MRAETSDNPDIEGDWQHEPLLGEAVEQHEPFGEIAQSEEHGHFEQFGELVKFTELDEPDEEPDTKENRALLPLLFFSLMGHGLALYLLQTSDSFTTAPPLALESPSIQLRLVTRPEPEPEVPPVVEQREETVVVTDVQPLPADTPVVAEEQSPAPVEVDMQLAESPAPLPIPSPAQPAPKPTTEGVRQIVQDIADRRQIDNSQFTCDALQQRNELIECGTDEVRDYRLLEGNFVVDYFNRLLPPPRTVRTIGVLAMQSDDSRGRIGTISLDGVDMDIFLHTLSNSYDGDFTAGDKKQQDIEDEMYANDGTYQIMKRVMRPR